MVSFIQRIFFFAIFEEKFIQGELRRIIYSGKTEGQLSKPWELYAVLRLLELDVSKKRQKYNFIKNKKKCLFLTSVIPSFSYSALTPWTALRLMVDYQYLVKNCGTWGWWWHGVLIAEFHAEGKWLSLLYSPNHTGIVANVEREMASDEWDRGFYFLHAERHQMIYWLWPMCWCFHYWCTGHHLYSVLMAVAAMLWESFGN